MHNDPAEDQPGHQHGQPEGHHHAPRSAADWDARYADRQVWSGRPNATLVAEAGDLVPGRALDVGCGEGADAIWLAQHGWQVTATDISGVAIDRARRAGEAADVDVEWLVADIAEGGLAGFDLVTVHYPALFHDDDDAAARALIAAVGPGGTLLFVGHATANGQAAHVGGQDPDERVQPADVVALLDGDWQVEALENRPHADGEHARHPMDSVLRARRV